MRIRVVVVSLIVFILGAGFLTYWHMNRATGEIILQGTNARSISGEPGTLYVFATFTNNGGPEWLNSVESSEATSVELFNPIKLARLPIPAGATPSLAADGAHIRLFGIEGDLDIGRLVPITLNFENAKALTTNVKVGSPLYFNGEAAESDFYEVGKILNIPEDIPAPAIAIETEKTETGWRIHVNVENFELAESTMHTGNINYDTGHAHLYVSGLKIARVFEDTVELGKLGPGKHELRVILVSDDHRALKVDGEFVTAATTIEVES